MRSLFGSLLWACLLCGAACGPIIIGKDPRPSCDGVIARDKVDLLLVVDASLSMRAPTSLLASQMDDLLGYFINPRCLDSEGLEVEAQPVRAQDRCPAGSTRQFRPVRDMHVGVISSNLGGHGSDSCKNSNDHGHLINRASISTYRGLGFSAWDADGKKSPAGLSDASLFHDRVCTMVGAAGATSRDVCGIEAPLEAWYRFLVDPDPYETIVNPGAQGDTTNSLEEVVTSGTDKVLLKQREAFLRPDSALVIVMLSDKNDCSIRDEGRAYRVAQRKYRGRDYRMLAAQSICSSAPDDACCLPCGQRLPTGCTDTCNRLEFSRVEDPLSLRCVDQKRRFGVDLLWPTERYVEGLKEPFVTDRHGAMVRNPLFIGGRTRCDIYLAGIVGVPWQDVVRRDSRGRPSLDKGLDATGRPLGGMQSGSELKKNDTWRLILGDPTRHIPPQDPLMVESVRPRSGTHPLINSPLPPPDAPFMSNPINGHEHAVPGELQYACIFGLTDPLSCGEAPTACACSEHTTNPLCQAPEGNYPGSQFSAGARPSLRQLEVLKGVGSQGIVGSLCPVTPAPSDIQKLGYRATLRNIASSVGRTSLVKP